MFEWKDLFDFSNCLKDSTFYDDTNKKVLLKVLVLKVLVLNLVLLKE